MRGILKCAALALAAFAAMPASADVYTAGDDGVGRAVGIFMEAIGDADKTRLAEVMIPEAVIFVHNRMDPENPRVDIVPVADHLERWAQGSRVVYEQMRTDHVLIDGDMAQVWGPYAFMVDGKVSHCGINSLSMVKMEDDSWKVGNTSFTMVPPDGCEALGMGWLVQ